MPSPNVFPNILSLTVYSLTMLQTILQMDDAYHIVVLTDLPPDIFEALIRQQNLTLQSISDLPSMNDQSVDCLLLWETAHQAKDIQATLSEGYRVIKPAGYLAIVDQLSPARPKLATYYNRFNQLHNWDFQSAYSLSDWDFFAEQAKFEIVMLQEIGLERRLGEWVSKVDSNTFERLRTMLLNAPAEIRDWYQLTASVGYSDYRDIQMIDSLLMLVAHKPT